MGVYDPLYRYLDSHPASAVTMSYAEIEKVLGRSLPDTARRDKKRQWWANTESHSQALAWLGARRRAKLDVNRLEVTFTRQQSDMRLRHATSDMLEIPVSQFDPSAIRMLEDIAQETGGDLSGALVALMNGAAKRRRQATLDWFAANAGPASGKSSVDMVREDRDAR